MPVRITLEGIGLNYGPSVVLNNVSYTFENPSVTGVAGPNGSGKSTLLKIISGNLSPSRGKITFFCAGEALPEEEIYTILSFAAPYIALPGELKMKELLKFCAQLKPWRPGLDTGKVMKYSELERFRERKIVHFSSGMKQRLKLAIAILQKSSLLILDEPGTNLDDRAKQWFSDLLKKNMDDRAVVIASNEKSDLQFCSDFIHLPS
jgi:ABC-type multidrug transport system ATPase subunit